MPQYCALVKLTTKSAGMGSQTVQVDGAKTWVFKKSNGGRRCAELLDNTG
jgi:hypothetical protein